MNTLDTSTPARESNLLRALVDLRDLQLQKARIQFGNRVNAAALGTDDTSPRQDTLTARYFDLFQRIEDDITSDIAVLIRAYPVYDHVSALRGIGPTLSAKLIALIGDISTFDNASKLWRFAGYGTVPDPKYAPDGDDSNSTSDVNMDTGEYIAEPVPRIAERAVKGEKLHYNRRLKVALYLVATSFMRSRSPYKALYDNARVKYDRTHPEWTLLHKHRAALRIMIKVFLTHLWKRWRTLEGLPTTDLYVESHLGHTTIYQPEDYGWPN